MAPQRRVNRTRDLINNFLVSAHQRSVAPFPESDESASLSNIRLSKMPLSLSSVVVNPWLGTGIESLVFNFTAAAGDKVLAVQMTAGEMYETAHKMRIVEKPTMALAWNKIQFDAARWLGYMFDHACQERARLGVSAPAGIPAAVIAGFQKNNVPQQLLLDYMDGSPDLRRAA